VILTHLPDLPPRPETTANAAFRRNFYSRWGRENAIVCGRETHAEYAAITQTLSIKMMRGGREHYHLPQRHLVVDDDNLLVINEGACYGSVLQASRPAWTFAIFFRPGMQNEVAAQRRLSLSAALDAADVPQAAVQFSEHLRPHQGPVSRRLQHIAGEILQGESDDVWLEEQLTALLLAMLDQEHERPADAAARPARRAELHRRLRQAADFIESHYPQALDLQAMAQAAHLSRFHFVREFARLYGLSPHAYLTRKRARAARRLLDSGATDKDLVAMQCGLGSRWSLQRALSRYGDHPLN
jgi:AraC-like DNA-binding protein